MNWFTSDNHFNHRSIPKHSKRLEFCSKAEVDIITSGTKEEISNLTISDKTVHTMNEEMISRWNARVGQKDFVYHLGDFCFRGFDSIFSRLRGRVIFIKGNHDDEAKKFKARFFSWHDFGFETSVQGQKLILCHYAMRVWNKSHHGSWHLYGHSHGSMANQGKSFDVGVDCHNYAPISFDEVAKIMESKNVSCVDHHV